MSRGAILVVDDNRVNSELLCCVLEADGYDVRAASNAEAALAELESYHPDILLTDLQMPGMDGLELTRRLKSTPATRHIIVAAVTAYAVKSDEERARAAGCDHFITKPVNTRTLGAELEACLRRARRTETAG